MALVLNFALYFITFLFEYRKEKITLYTFLLLEYSVISLMGLYSFYTGIYENIFGPKNIDSLSIIPYVLCYLFFLIFFKPLSKLRIKDINIPNTRIINKFINFWFLIIILYTGLKLSECIVALSTGMGQMYEDRHINGETLFDYSGNILLRRINSIGAVLINTTIPLVIVYCISIINKKSASLKTYIMIILCFIPLLLQGISFGSRGIMFGVFIKMVFYYIVLKDYISKKIKRYIFLLGVSITLIMLFYSLIITYERFGNDQNAFSGIARYFGECFPNLGFIFWDNVKEHPMGERLFPDILDVDLTRFWFSVDSMYAYWWNRTGVPVLNFKTLFGDMYIEFGVIGAFIFAIIMNRIMNKVIYLKTVPYYFLSYCAIYFQIAAIGFAGLTQIGGFNNVLIIVAFVINSSLYFYDKKYKS